MHVYCECIMYWDNICPTPISFGEFANLKGSFFSSFPFYLICPLTTRPKEIYDGSNSSKGSPRLHANVTRKMGV